MATITTDTFLDGGVARTAGEAWTCNGGRLTIRTDSRWHADAPAAMAGSLGSLTISSTLGGGYTIDGRNVRWLPYDTGSGNVPAIGTTVTQGGVSGYLLGVWASLTAAPTAVGAAMPASGFIKFREVTSGPFAAGALSGIGANATGPDVVGWIEVVHDQSTVITVPRLGDFTVRGDWFDLGTTSGAANQLVQLPTNGSATTYVPGVWIETATADVYEFYPAIYAAGMTTTNLGTDERSKFVCMETNGSIRIGHNGTTAVGYVPPAGRKIRTPNVFMRQCTTAARATNAIPHATLGTRPDFVTTSAGAIDWDHCTCDWYVLFAQPYSVRLVDFAAFDTINVSECATALDFENGGIGFSQSLDVNALALTSNFAGGTIVDWAAHRHSTGANDHAVNLQFCIGQTFTRVAAGILTYARTTSGVAFYMTQCDTLTFDQCRQFNGQMLVNTSFNIEVTDFDHCDRYRGVTNNTSSIHAIAVTGKSSGVLVDGFTFGLGGTIANCHPNLYMFSATASNNLRFRNAGTRASPLSGGTADSVSGVFTSGGNNSNVKVQRCYLTTIRGSVIASINSDTNMLYEHLMETSFVYTPSVVSLNSNYKSASGGNGTGGNAAVYGTHFFDTFLDNTSGRIILALNEPTAQTAPLVTVVSGAPKFTSAGNLKLVTVGDEIIIEQGYFVKGHTGLANTAPVVTGTNVTYSSGARWGNHDIYYQLDTGSGWNGTWKDLTAANLSSETVSPTGFKLKYRIVCATANTTNLLTYIRANTLSTLAAQTDNLYPLDTVTLELTGLKNPTEVRVFNAGTTTEIGGQENVTSGTFAAQIDGGAYPTVDISVLALGYQNTRLLGIDLSGGDVSIPVQQIIDRQYANP